MAQSLGPVPARLAARIRAATAASSRSCSNSSSSPSPSRSPTGTSSCRRRTSSTCSSRARSTCSWRWRRSSRCCSAEIDLSVGLVMGLGARLVAEDVQPPTRPRLAVVAGDRRLAAGICSAVGAHPGHAGRPPRMPSFIVTLGGLLILEGVSIIVLGGRASSVSATPISTTRSSSTTSLGAVRALRSAGSCSSLSGSFGGLAVIPGDKARRRSPVSLLHPPA